MTDRQAALDLISTVIREDGYAQNVITEFPGYASMYLVVDGVEYSVSVLLAPTLAYLEKTCELLHQWADVQLPEKYPDVDFSKSPRIIVIEHFRSPRS